MSKLVDNLNRVKETVAAACEKTGRSSEDVLVLAVSKTKPAEDILELYNAGHRDFGENYVQELKEKAELLPKDIQWHMIGHLQRNKVKYIAPYVAMIHSVDSQRLAEQIEKEAEKCGRSIPVLIEINAGEEESKFGLSFDEAEALFYEIEEMPHVIPRGFMTSAPLVDDPEKNRKIFREMADFCVDINRKKHNNEIVNVLSMGMSNDYSVAVEEGATIVRVGTTIFGARDYSKSKDGETGR